MVSAAQAGQARRHTESQMTSPAHVYRAIESSVDLETVVTKETHYQGPCKIWFPSSISSDQDSSGQQFNTQSGMMSIPFGCANTIKTDDLVDALGHIFRVTGLIPQTFSDSQRFPIVLDS